MSKEDLLEEIEILKGYKLMYQNLHEQNKRYREALEKLVNAPQDMSRGRYADYADRVAREALEDEK